MAKLFRVVLDTNVLFEGLTKRNSVCGVLIDAWFDGLIQPCVSNALLYEYFDVLSRRLSPDRYEQAKRAMPGLPALARPVTIHFRWRPSSPDPGDDFLIDCAMNAGAILITSNIRDFRLARQMLGLRVLTPQSFLRLLLEE